MRCKLGPKKHRRCEEIAGRKYEDCLVRGGQTHFVAQCVRFPDDSGRRITDLINYKTGEFLQADIWLSFFKKKSEPPAESQK